MAASSSGSIASLPRRALEQGRDQKYGGGHGARSLVGGWMSDGMGDARFWAISAEAARRAPPVGSLTVDFAVPIPTKRHDLTPWLYRMIDRWWSEHAATAYRETGTTQLSLTGATAKLEAVMWHVGDFYKLR
jgi:hypothetical protein